MDLCFLLGLGVAGLVLPLELQRGARLAFFDLQQRLPACVFDVAEFGFQFLGQADRPVGCDVAFDDKPGKVAEADVLRRRARRRDRVVLRFGAVLLLDSPLCELEQIIGVSCQRGNLPSNVLSLLPSLFNVNGRRVLPGAANTRQR